MLSYLVDEHLRGVLAVVLVRVSKQWGFDLDVIEVGDPAGPEFGIKDPQLLLWAEAEDCVLLTLDRSTLPRHLNDHLATGRHSPGIFMLRDRPLIRIAEYLVTAAVASDPAEWRDKITYVPQ